MLLLIVEAAFAAPCNVSVLSVIRAIPAPEAPIVTLGQATAPNGTALAGARVVMHSQYPLSAWTPVIQHPETQDDWAPADMGTKRVERLDTSHIFQQTHLNILMGAVQIKRQVVVEINWLEQSTARIKNCWQMVDPTPFKAQIAPWVDDSPFETTGMGSWEVEALPDNSTRVSYQMWVPATLLPANVMAWAMSRTFPDLIRVFDQRVAALSG
jgi:hypothetical protein